MIRGYRYIHDISHCPEAADLAHAPADYAALYNRAYSDKAEMADLIPAMLEFFLASDRVFAKARKESEAGT